MVGFERNDLSSGLGVFGAEQAKLVVEALSPLGRGLGLVSQHQLG